MNDFPDNLYLNNFIPLRKNARKITTDKNLKRRFLVKIKKRFPALNNWNKSKYLIQKSEQLKYNTLEINKIAQGIEHLEECIFFYVNGVIQMATIPKSAS